MLRYVTVNIPYTVSVEILADAFASLAKATRKLHGIIPTAAAGIYLRAYLNQQQIVNVPSDIKGTAADPEFLVDAPLTEKDALQVGYLFDADAAANLDVTLVFED